MYQFKWPLCKKSAVLVLVWCYKATGDRAQDLWRYWLPEGCIKQWCDQPYGWWLHLQNMCAGGGMKNCLLPLLFLRSLSILSGCHIAKISICLQDMKLWWIGPMAYHPQIGFHYSKLLTHLPYDCGNFSNISGMGWCGSLVKVDVVPLAVSILWPQSHFQGE